LTTIGTPGSPGATRMMLLGAGELGKEVAIEAQRFGVEVIAVDRYPGAPAMQVAHRSHVIDMLDGEALTALVVAENPTLIVPEIEAIATAALLALEARGHCVVPTARATHLTMNREGIRRLAAEELSLPTSPYEFADDEAACREAVSRIGLPCVIKPVMSSSGKGQSTLRTAADVAAAWTHSQAGGRSGAGRVIVEGFIEFDYEITLLTLRHGGHTSFCAPIGHLQIDGDYRESWQPHPMTPTALERAQQIARVVTDALGGNGIFGVELFVRDDEVWFSEVSPRPHDTGLVTLVSQELSEFALHARAILGLPIPSICALGPAASVALLAQGDSRNLRFSGLAAALAEPDTALRLFGKPEVHGRRRVGVALARGNSLIEARERARRVADAVHIQL
jgi:phosphoribosylglycinamide formyltransferase 2